MLTQFRYFVAIVEHGGLTAASSALGVSQPALTRSLQTLECQLDVKLLERGNGVIALTRAGGFILNRVRAMLAEETSLRADLAVFNANQNAVTYVNGSPITALTLLPRILGRMSLEHPELRVSVRGDNGADYAWKIEALRSGELDAVVTIHDPALDDRTLEQTLLFEPKLRIVVSRNHPACQLPEVTLHDLVSSRWILPPSGSRPRMLVDDEFRRHGLRPALDTLELSDWRMALDLVHDAQFVTALPYHPACFEDQLARFAVLPYEFRIQPLGISLITRTLSAQRSATQTFARVTREVVAKFKRA